MGQRQSFNGRMSKRRKTAIGYVPARGPMQTILSFLPDTEAAQKASILIESDAKDNPYLAKQGERNFKEIRRLVKLRSEGHGNSTTKDKSLVLGALAISNIYIGSHELASDIEFIKKVAKTYNQKYLKYEYPYDIFVGFQEFIVRAGIGPEYPFLADLPEKYQFLNDLEVYVMTEYSFDEFDDHEEGHEDDHQLGLRLMNVFSNVSDRLKNDHQFIRKYISQWIDAINSSDAAPFRIRAWFTEFIYPHIPYEVRHEGHTAMEIYALYGSTHNRFWDPPSDSDSD